jgi:hypothetical protein
LTPLKPSLKQPGNENNKTHRDCHSENNEE